MPGERPDDRRAPTRLRFALTLLGDARPQRHPPSGRTTLIGKHTSRDAQQPRLRVARHFIEAAPRNQKRLGDGFLRVA